MRTFGPMPYGPREGSSAVTRTAPSHSPAAATCAAAPLAARTSSSTPRPARAPRARRSLQPTTTARAASMCTGRSPTSFAAEVSACPEVTSERG